jgi:hypothetical protein
MRTATICTLLAASLLAGCAQVGGLFGRGTAPAPAEAPPVRSAAGLIVAPDGSVLLPGAQAATADRNRQGLILRAEAIAPAQGFHDPRLVTVRPLGPDGIEVVEFRAAAPPEPLTVGAPATRVLMAARFYSDAELRAIRGFRILGSQGAVSVSVPAAPPAPEPPPLPDF